MSTAADTFTMKVDPRADPVDQVLTELSGASVKNRHASFLPCTSPSWMRLRFNVPSIRASSQTFKTRVHLDQGRVRVPARSQSGRHIDHRARSASPRIAMSLPSRTAPSRPSLYGGAKCAALTAPARDASDGVRAGAEKRASNRTKKPTSSRLSPMLASARPDRSATRLRPDHP